MKVDKRHFMDLVEKQIRSSLHWDSAATYSDRPTLVAAAEHICLAEGAKRARPKLVYYLSKGLGLKSNALENTEHGELNQKLVLPKLVDVAVCVEFIHSASLLHDDVIDNGVLRRNRATVNQKWDNLTAVLAGDLLLAESIKGLRNCPREVAQGALELVAEMTRSTMLEAHVRASTEVTPEQWLYIADGKTSSMFRWCGQAVGQIMQSEEAVERFGLFGTHFGIAFQMADDLLDLQPELSGKTPFADIRNRNPSYPMILAQQESPAFRDALALAWKGNSAAKASELRSGQEFITGSGKSCSSAEASAFETIPEATVMELGKMIAHTSAKDRTRERITEEVNIAIDALGPYRDVPGCREVAMWAAAMCQRFQIKVPA